MKVTTSDIRLAIRNLGLAGRPLCVHSSLRSFGWREERGRTMPALLIAVIQSAGAAIMLLWAGLLWDNRYRKKCGK